MHSMITLRSPVFVAIILTIVATMGPAFAGQDGTTPPTMGDRSAAESIIVQTPQGPVVFHVIDPDAVDSVAWTDDAIDLSRAGSVFAGRDIELTDRVIVRVDDPSRLDSILDGDPALSAKPLLAGQGYWVLATGSVRRAAMVADGLVSAVGVSEVSVDLDRRWVLRTPSDPKFSDQWHLKNDLEPLFDVNAEAAWNLGFTGDGVVIGIVEDAWQHTHPDLAGNYNAAGSQTGGSISGHATSCAGVAAAVADNGVMGAGVAYGAWISDQLFGSDEETADALAYANDINDIKSNSWGPPDIGHIYFLPPVIGSAIEEGVTNGRGGLGEIYVWAAGNGGTGDRTDYDPFVSSRYTIAVGAIGDGDTRANYNESGSCMLVVAHSSGNSRAIGTTTSGSGWTPSFGGTSSASPLAAGVIALMLEANPNLTWRDVQHILVESARKNDPGDADWITNGAGYTVNYNYGFGAVDAGAAVTTAQGWVNVPHEVVADSGVIAVNQPIIDNDPAGVVETVQISDNIRIETVELVLNVQSNFIGDLAISMTGPDGTESVFAEARLSDGQNDYVDYTFTSYRHWGENSAGEWSVKIADLASPDGGTWIDYRLIFHGTPACPGDVDGDGIVALSDLAALLSSFGQCEGDALFEPAFDFDNSKCVDLTDLARFLSLYGTDCN